MKKLLLCLGGGILSALTLQAHRARLFTSPWWPLVQSQRAEAAGVVSGAGTLLEWPGLQWTDSLATVAAEIRYRRLLSRLQTGILSEEEFGKRMADASMLMWNNESLLYRGEYLFRNARYDESWNSFWSAGAELSRHEQRDIARLKVYGALAAGEPAAALKHQAGAARTSNREFLYREALLARAEENYVRTDSLYAVLEKEPDYAPLIAWCRTEDVYLRKRRGNASPLGTTGSPAQAVAQLNAQVLIVGGEFAEAEKLLDSVMRSGSPRRSDRYRLALCRYQQGNMRAALSEFLPLMSSGAILAQHAAWYAAASATALQ